MSIPTSLVLLAGVAIAAPLPSTIPTITLPGGGKLPKLYMGAGDFTAWLKAAGKGAGVKTAYGYGNQETILPAVTRAGFSRSDVFLETMIPCGVSAPQNATHMTTALAKEFIKLDLELLGTDYVDLLLVHHRCNSPEETKALWLALEAALTSGVAKAIGVSNFDADDLRMLAAVAKQPIAVNEGHFAVGVIDYDTIAVAKQHNITLVSFSSLAAGVPGDHPTITAVASRHNVSNAAVMLKYVSAKGISVLSSISKPEYTAEDIGIFAFELSAQDEAELDGLQTGRRTCPDCYTNECQACSHALADAGCPVGSFPTAGRDNPHGAECMACAAEHNSTIMKTCREDWMVPKGCGQAGGFPRGIA